MIGMFPANPIKQRALDLGFDLVGLARLLPSRIWRFCRNGLETVTAARCAIWLIPGAKICVA